MDILTLKLANRYTDSRLRMTVTIADKHIFSSEAARDAYFASKPGELEEGLYVQAGTQFFRYHDEEWVEVTAIIQGPEGEKGDQGEKGEKGDKGDQGPEGEKGDQGEKGEKGDKGDPPAHEWEGTALRFGNPDGSWGQSVDLKGEKGDQGPEGEKGDKGDQGPKGEKGDKGDTGPMPGHEWQGTAIRFQKSDGTWPSTWVDLKGDSAYHATLTATLDTDDWTGIEAPFTQVQTVSGILATDAPIVDVVLSGDWEVDEARLEAWGYIYRIVTSNNSITAYAREKPDVALPLQLKVVR